MRPDKLNLKNFRELFFKPLFLSILLLFTIIFCVFVLSAPTYETIDDSFMRTLVEGSYTKSHQGSYFLMFTSSIIGRFLSFLYITFPGFYWYDIYELSLLSIATLIIGICVFSKSDLVFNTFCFLALFFILTPCFVQFQFSVVSGTLSIAILVYAIDVLQNGIKNKSHLFVSILIVLSLSFFAVLVRHNIFILMFMVGFLYFCLFISRNNYKRFIFLSIGGGFVSLLVIAIFYACVLNDSLDPDIQYAMKSNDYLVMLYNDTIATSNLKRPWEPIENSVFNLNKLLSKHGWYRGDYRLLLAWADLGNYDIFSNEKKSMIVNEIGDLISVKNNSQFRFSVQDYMQVLKRYFWIPIVLLFAFFNKKTLIYFVSFTLIFVFSICLLNLVFRSIPHRVWINMANLGVVVFLYYLKVNSKFIMDSTSRIIIEIK